MGSNTVIQCTKAKHAHAILAILNEAILTSTALYDYEPRSLQSMDSWFAAKEHGNYPVIGIEDSSGTLLAFGSLGTFRAWPAYKYTAEHSIYVHKEHRGKGLGKHLLQALIDAAQQRDIHALIGGIDATNIGSIALHTRLGFKHTGTLVQVGFKFGKWLDLAFYQRVLDTPTHPIDG